MSSVDGTKSVTKGTEERDKTKPRWLRRCAPKAKGDVDYATGGFAAAGAI